MAEGEPEAAPSASAARHSVERLINFTDAVVAIALTLLILPLLDGVTETAGAGGTTADYLADSGSQLVSFGVSFVIILNFWRTHHRLFERVARFNGALFWLNAGWMLTIVWLPVATALSGLTRSDAVQELLYIGTMLLSSLLLTGATLVVRRHPEMWSTEGPPAAAGLALNLALTTMYGVALLLALVVPGLDYRALFVLFLTAPLQKVILRRLPEREVTA